MQFKVLLALLAFSTVCVVARPTNNDGGEKECEKKGQDWEWKQDDHGNFKCVLKEKDEDEKKHCEEKGKDWEWKQDDHGNFECVMKNKDHYRKRDDHDDGRKKH